MAHSPITRRVPLALLLYAACAAVPAADLLPSFRSRAPAQDESRPEGVPDDATLQAAGAVIGEVRQVRLNVFDTRLPEEDTTLFRLANRLHPVTRETPVLAQLLFKPGDRYDPRLLAESERILRSRAYLHDARIRPVAWHDGVVDLEVTTQDTWTLKPEINYGRKGGRNTSGFGIEEMNLLGTGAELGLKFKSDVDRDTRTLLYNDRNLVGSDWHLAASLSDNSDGKAKAFLLERPFYSLDTRWAAGVKFSDDQRVDSVYVNGTVFNQYATHERLAEVYAGWSAGLRDGWVVRWRGGLGQDERSTSALASGATTGPRPVDRQLVYPWVSVQVVQDDYRETRNLDQIGRTEDLVLGVQGTLKLGWATPAFGADRRALLVDAALSNGWQPIERNTLLAAATLKGRVDDGRVADTLVGVTARHYWRQTPQRSFFAALAVDRGINLDVDQLLTLGGDTGVRGYPIRYRSGQGRWLFTAEQRHYSDWYPFRLFYVGGAVFFDMGRTWGGNGRAAPGVPAASPALLKDAGIGLRLGNSRSALGDVVHVDLAFPMGADAGVRKWQLHVEAKRTF